MISMTDKVTISDYYVSNYNKSWINENKDKSINILSIKNRTIKSSNIDKDTRPVYRALYGDVEDYPLQEILISFEGSSDVYMVSQLGLKVL